MVDYIRDIVLGWIVHESQWRWYPNGIHNPYLTTRLANGREINLAVEEDTIHIWATTYSESIGSTGLSTTTALVWNSIPISDPQLIKKIDQVVDLLQVNSKIAQW